jgi:hypothetical protein
MAEIAKSSHTEAVQEQTNANSRRETGRFILSQVRGWRRYCASTRRVEAEWSVPTAGKVRPGTSKNLLLRTSVVEGGVCCAVDGRRRQYAYRVS